ncbi:cell division protein FtsQ [Lachnospiraceae bacterium KM106-2]|nr:cell division protein FtsQ [Lachnospiraceae bacterium KM106-2]
MSFQRKRINIKRLLAFIVILVMGLAMYVLTAFDLNTIEVVGNKYSTDETVASIIRKNTYQNTLYVYSKIRFKNTYKIPFADGLEVDYVNRHKIKVRVIEKEIAGCLEYMNQYVYFDEDGNVLEISKKKIAKIPVISGIPFEEIQLYGKVKVKDEKIFNKILNISEQIQQYNMSIDKIMYDSQNNLVLYMNKVRVYLGDKKSYDAVMAELAKILPKAKKLKGYFDLTDYEAGQDKIYFHVE